MYSVKDFETEIQKIKPRAFDTYVLPAFMVGYAIKSKGMPKTARRILFSAAVYMTYRNYAIYKKQFLTLREKVANSVNPPAGETVQQEEPHEQPYL